MDNIILKITYGELFEFFDSDSKNEFVIGAKRSCDLVLKAAFAAPEQIRCIRRDGVWYAEDMTPEGAKSEVLLNGKRFKRPIVRLDDEITVRKAGDKKNADVVPFPPCAKSPAAARATNSTSPKRRLRSSGVTRRATSCLTTLWCRKNISA